MTERSTKNVSHHVVDASLNYAEGKLDLDGLLGELIGAIVALDTRLAKIERALEARR